MPLIVIDVESDGPVPHLYSMVCFGAVAVEPGLSRTFYGQLRPISDAWIPEALAISGFTREQHLAFDPPEQVMAQFAAWLAGLSPRSPVFLSDNLAFDWQWINYYFHRFAGSNPFGYSGRRIGDLYCGMQRDMGLNAEWKRRYRKTRHTHHPVDDAQGNAEAMLAFREMGLKMKLD
ncbi:MAG: 3'-5' exoribonuclease [Bacteroidia bacterium]|nr:3'-5' exoribonuclease [Bacteroidia bacterium]